ncbi:choice-of-anchor D domain-containing protein [Roseibacillus ishigakijimensis]|uniref:Choice-of-anchor D domain-containing protein n=1 Tax=Roseibacillus ishigakijimensis TaxID=454146 RepID=A0A934RR90_9BACT|nr:choice-of-anchor D domain-containing protein [Roseibacillus ishigakijimensis]MBK1835448.1 choice-of-anchor D domain-containing protein [Roseibacillus ishigakijimensis]
MKSYLLPLILFLFTFPLTLSAAPNILIEGWDGAFWPNISDNDHNPNQQVTDFDSVWGNEIKNRQYRIRNTGNQNLVIYVNDNSPSSTSSQFTFPGFPSSNFSIAPGNELEFTIRYRPVTASRTATIRIDSNDPDAESTYTFAVTGEGRLGEASVYYKLNNSNDTSDHRIVNDEDTTPSTNNGTNFGAVEAGQHKDHHFYIRNSSGASDPLRIRAPRLSGSGASHFEIRSLGTSNLGVGNNRDFHIRFKPTSSGTKTATFTFDNNDANENPYSFTITGVGVAEPEIAVEGKRNGVGTTLDPVFDGTTSSSSSNGTLFNDTNVGDERRSTFRISNTGNQNLTISNRSFSGTGASHFLTAGFPANSTIAPGNHEEFEVIFRPTSSGAKTAVLSFGNNDSNEDPFSFTLRGTAHAPEIRIAGRPNELTGFDNIANGETTPREIEGTDFGRVRVEGNTSNVNHFKIVNDGSQGLNISNPRLVGPHSSDFSFSGVNSAFNIAAGNEREFTITFNPTAEGVRNATFLINSNDPDEPFYSFALQGEGYGFPEIRVQGRQESHPGNPTPTLTEISDGKTVTEVKDGTELPTTKVGESSEMVVRVHNDGDVALDFGTRTFAGSGASQFNTVGFPTNGALDPGSQIEFRIRFTPTSFGTKTATFSFGNSDAGEDPFNFNLSALAEAPEMELAGRAPDNVFRAIADGDLSPSQTNGTDFGNTNVTGTQAQRLYRITNTGNSNLNISGRNFSGPAAGDYSVSGLFAGNPFVNIGPGESQTFTITFDPSTEGPRDAVFSIENNDPNEDPYNFALTGFGIGFPEIRVRGRQEAHGGNPTPTFSEIADGDTTPRAADGTRFPDTRAQDGPTFEDPFISRFRIHNDGDGDLEIGSPSLAGNHPDQFTLEFFPNGHTLAIGESVDFRVHFVPTSFGEKSAVLSFTTNDEDESPFNFTLSGRAEAPEISVRGGGASFSEVIPDGDATPQASDGTLFGEVNPEGGSLIVPFRIYNTGNVTLRIVDKNVFGPDAADFTIRSLNPNPIATTIGAGDYKEFEIEFDPSDKGTRTATIRLDNDDPNENPYTFMVQGIGADPDATPEIVVLGTNLQPITIGDSSPSSQDGTDFGSPVEGSSPLTRTFTIRNTGDTLLEIYAISTVNNHYTATTPAAIAEGSQETFTVTFDPAEAGSQQGQISIFSNDPTASQFTFAVTAEVTATNTSDPEVTAMEIDGDDIILTANLPEGRTFSLMQSTTLQENSWSTVPGHANLSGSADAVEITLSDFIDSAENPRLFFRLVERAQ